MPKPKRTERVEIRLTPAELSLVKRMAEDLEISVSELFRYKTLKK